MKSTLTALIISGFAAASSAAPTGSWKIVKDVDKMTDKTSCRLQYLKSARVWYSDRNTLDVSFIHEGGVTSYRYRIDKLPASELHLGEQWGRKFISIYDDDLATGQRLLISGLTFVPERVFELEIDLRGLARAAEEMRRQCGISAPPVPANYPPIIPDTAQEK